ncbi:hypothetical protein ACT3CD_11885 [Geofilum sp. OHC36d9]|uniref:hypothetical protein n=1 Tax=Geofilum sp. OHC36d9 TaxID=3458413 RepID=UPI0040333F70
MKLKNKYNKPEIREVLIDQSIAVFMTSEGSGPDPSDKPKNASPSSDGDSFNENKLEENPFER